MSDDLKSKKDELEIKPRRVDEVHEAGDESFPASDPPAYTSAPPRRKKKWADGSSKGSSPNDG